MVRNYSADALAESAEQLESAIRHAQMVILPGGIPGGLNLRDSDRLMEILEAEAAAGKFVAAICAAPIALERAGLLDGKNYTAYVGYAKKIAAGHYREEILVRDGNLITSRGPATAYAFGYALAEALGADTTVLREKMLYNLFGR